ncbi:AraC family transcriptional regulator [Leucobacter luti]|uniref:HTH-type transcriptional regulator RipA n=1 Tax=Leucobacter luti TaxID=340320 RepID=A0A4V6MBZ7_9MICO|nr:AraC family transcriptional regulator [Leucobacter luti]MBL3699872.1 AraC family transcriptional regulator [Leucobacter luti]RZT62809.1 AraC-like DNA-binding protein [Leucobacter luti]
MANATPDTRDRAIPGAAAAAAAWAREPGTVLRGADASWDRVPHEFTILSGSQTAGEPLEWEPHTHEADELVWTRGGTMSVRAAGRIFTVPEGRGLWLPAGVQHGGRLTARAELFTAVFAPGLAPTAFAGAAVTEMSPLLEALLEHLARPDLDAAARARAEAVVFDVLEPVSEGFALRVPGDARIDPIATALLADPADVRGLDEWARELGVSARTVTRAFREATGLSFARWRMVLRVHLALELLAAGAEVRAVSARLGYAQTSTFIAAFRGVLGETPGAYVERGRKSVSPVSPS